MNSSLHTLLSLMMRPDVQSTAATHTFLLCARPLQVLLRALQLCRGVFRPCIRALQVYAQVTHLFNNHRNVNSNGAS